MRRKLRTPIDFWALPAPVQDGILEQTVRSSYVRALRWRVVCKHFDKHIRRLVYGGGLIESWPFLKKDDLYPLRLSLLESTKSRNHKNLPLIKYLRDATDAMTLELEDTYVQLPEYRKPLSSLANSLNKLQLDSTHDSIDEDAVLDRSHIAEVVFTTAAAALCHHDQKFIVNLINNAFKNKELKFERVPLALYAAFGLKDRIENADRADLDIEDDIFGKPLTAASVNGQKDIVQLILMISDSARTLESNTLYHAACAGHVSIMKLLLHYGFTQDWQCYLLMENAVRGAICNRRIETLRVAFEVYQAETPYRISFATHITLAIKAGAYDILTYLLDALDEHRSESHHSSSCWRCNYMGNAVQEAVWHPNDGPLEQILARGLDPNNMSRYGVEPYLLARRVKTFKLLHAHGVNLSKDMGYYLLRAVRYNWFEHISFLASIKKPSDDAVFEAAMARAVRKNRKECIKALLDAGFDPVSPCPSESEEKEEKRTTSHLMYVRDLMMNDFRNSDLTLAR